ncbi:APC family permease [Flavobacterium sp. JP2137]|uniref:APC family permease n=1 Tax=Flavobacterium sp. JP2137 TaxID=3414510 RepID=UPI003D301270
MQKNLTYKISTLAGIAIVMANMIGTGVFTSLGFQLKEMQNPISILTLWILGGVLALSGAFSYAEVGTYIRKSGGEYAFLSEIYHPIVGYLSGWISLTVGFAAPIALAAIAFTEYFQFGGFSTKWSSVLIVAVITFIHTKNLRTSSRFQIISTLFKILVTLAIILSGLVMTSDTNISLEITPDYYREIKSGAFAISLIYVTYSYSGWNAAAYITEEFETPRKSLPIALVGGTLIVTFLYTLLQFVFLKHVPIAELTDQIEVGAIATEKMFGESISKFFSIVISILLISSISAMVWVGPRVTSSMANQHRLWHYFKTAKNKIPQRALWLQFAISFILIATGSFEQIMIYCGVLLTLSTMLVVYAVFILRFKNKDKKTDTYRSPLFPLFQILYLVLSSWMIIYTITNHPYETTIGLLNLLIGMITYYISRRLTNAKSIKE